MICTYVPGYLRTNINPFWNRAQKKCHYNCWRLLNKGSPTVTFQNINSNDTPAKLRRAKGTGTKISSSRHWRRHGYWTKTRRAMTITTDTITHEKAEPTPAYWSNNKSTVWKIVVSYTAGFHYQSTATQAKVLGVWTYSSFQRRWFCLALTDSIIEIPQSPVFKRIFTLTIHPRDIQALWSHNHDTGSYDTLYEVNNSSNDVVTYWNMTGTHVVPDRQQYDGHTPITSCKTPKYFISNLSFNEYSTTSSTPSVRADYSS